MLVDEEADLIPGALNGREIRLMPLQHADIPVLNHPREQIPLVGEEPVDAALDHARPLGDVRNQGVIVALFVENSFGGRQDIGNALLRRESTDLSTGWALVMTSFEGDNAATMTRYA